MASTEKQEAACQKNTAVLKIIRISRKMANHPQLSFMLLALILAVASNYANSTSKPLVVPQPLPRRFFPISSNVLDYPYGNIGDVGNLLISEEVLFVMYYAPWCAQSRRVRAEFEKAAGYLKDEIRFIGVNCWFPNGTCRQQNNFLGYPNLFFYHTTLDGFRYRGVLTAEYIISFVQTMLRPLTHLTNKEEIAVFRADRDNAVLGFFDFNSSPQPPGFYQFYYASMRTLESDPKNPVSYAIITDPEVARLHYIEKTGSVHLARSMNFTAVYPYNDNMTSSHLVAWVAVNRQPLSVAWSLHSGYKNLGLSTIVANSPTLIVFLPHYPLLGGNNYVSILREVSLDYYNCANSTKVSNIISSLKYTRWLNGFRQKDLISFCKTTDGGSKMAKYCSTPHQYSKPLPTKQCCQSVLVSGSLGVTNSCDVCVNYPQTNPLSWQACDMRSVLDYPSWPELLESLPRQQGVCAELMPYYNPGEFLTVCCENHSYYDIPSRHQYSKPPSSKRRSNDPFVINAVKYGDQQLCQKLLYQKRFGWRPSEVDMPGVTDSFSPNITGLGCQTNRSLAFIAMDIRWNLPFAKSLGLDLTSKSKHPTAVIFDNREEAFHIMKDPFTKYNIVEFIQNYTDNELARDLRSAPVVESSCEDKGDDVCIVEVTTKNFHSVVMDEDRDVLLMYYAPWCGFCAGFAHIYLSLAKYFHSTKTFVAARLNAYTNDLHWEYTVDVYPTIILFPAHRKSESITFPDHLKKSLPNLIYFVLHYGTPSLKIETGLGICSHTCIQSNKEFAVSHTQGLNSAINKILIRLEYIHNRLKDFNKVRTESDDDVTLEFYQDGSSLLEWYQKILIKRLFVKRMQRNQARYLHRTLSTCLGPFIERHKLMAVLHKYQMHQKLLDKLLNEDHMMESISEDDLLNIYENNDITITNVVVNDPSSHDEL